RPPTIANRIEVTPESLSLAWGERTSLLANLGDSHNQRSADIRWYSSDPATAAVDSAGRVSAYRPGRVEIIAEVNGWRADTAHLRVLETARDPAKFRESFELWRPERFQLLGEPKSLHVMRDGRGALRIPGDGNYIDGLIS